jgi:hypothetical protein
MPRITLASAFILAGMSAALATPSIPNREPGMMDTVRTYDVMIVPCTGEDCETDPPPYSRWLERDPQLRSFAMPIEE